MGRGLTTFGAVLLLATLALWIADAVGTLSPELDASWSSVTLKAGLGLLAGGLILQIVSPVRKQLVRGHCEVCGHAVERGHRYCRDHMQEVVNTLRDQTRDTILRGGRNHS